jgi:hypothetical protein
LSGSGSADQLPKGDQAKRKKQCTMHNG